MVPSNRDREQSPEGRTGSSNSSLRQRARWLRNRLSRRKSTISPVSNPESKIDLADGSGPVTPDDELRITRSLWGCAYENLRKEDEHLVTRYEELLSREAHILGMYRTIAGCARPKLPLTVAQVHSKMMAQVAISTRNLARPCSMR